MICCKERPCLCVHDDQLAPQYAYLRTNSRGWLYAGFDEDEGTPADVVSNITLDFQIDPSLTSFEIEDIMHRYQPVVTTILESSDVCNGRRYISPEMLDLYHDIAHQISEEHTHLFECDDEHCTYCRRSKKESQ